jgi:hypothetical protein
MSEENKCPICGEPTNVYMGKARKDGLCRKHGMQANKGEIIQCEECKKWHNVDEICACKSKQKKTAFTDELTCIICGASSNGKHFCFECWNKYKDKSIDIRITNCKEVKILDQYGNLTIECDDGRRVRSRAEALISNFFYNNKIRSVYEKTVYYEENGESKTLHPDFYLPDYDLYIEYNEIKKKSYLKSKEYTKKIYEKLGLKVVIMDDQDLNSIAGFLKPILKIN